MSAFGKRSVNPDASEQDVPSEPCQSFGPDVSGSGEMDRAQLEEIPASALNFRVKGIRNLHFHDGFQLKDSDYFVPFPDESLHAIAKSLEEATNLVSSGAVVLGPSTEGRNGDESTAPCFLVAASRVAALKLLHDITPGLGPILRARQWDQMFNVARECDVDGSGKRDGMRHAPKKTTSIALGKRCRENEEEETQRKQARKDATAAEASRPAGSKRFDGVDKERHAVRAGSSRRVQTISLSNNTTVAEASRPAGFDKVFRIEKGKQAAKAGPSKRVEIISLSDNSDDSNESSKSCSPSPSRRPPFHDPTVAYVIKAAEDLDDEFEKDEMLLRRLQDVIPDIEWIRKTETETRLSNRRGAGSKKRTTKRNDQGMIMMEAEMGRVMLKKAEEFKKTMCRVNATLNTLSKPDISFKPADTANGLAMAVKIHFDKNQLANLDAACLTEERQRLFIQLLDMSFNANFSATAANMRQKVGYLILANHFDDQVAEVLSQRALDGGCERPRGGGGKAATLVTTALVDLYRTTGGALRTKRRLRMGPKLLLHNQLSVARKWRHMVEELGHGVLFFDPVTQPTVNWLERQPKNVLRVFSQMAKNQRPTNWKKAGERCWELINGPEAFAKRDLDKLENVEHVAQGLWEGIWGEDDGNAGGKVGKVDEDTSDGDNE